MSKTTNHFTAGYKASFPSQDGNNSKSSVYLTQSIIRKVVEQCEWLINQKTQDILQLIDDKTQITSADQVSDDKLTIIVAKYGAARGGIHSVDIAEDRIDQRIESIDSEIAMLQDHIADQKQAFKDCTGDEYTAYKKKPQYTRAAPDKKKMAAITDKYMAQAAE